MSIDRHKLIRLRKAKGSQGRLAKKAGVSQQLISQLETSDNLTTKKLPQIAAALDVTVADLDPDFYTETTGISVPLISWITAGKMTTPDLVQEIEDAPRVYDSSLDPKGDWIALTVDGDSMDRISPPESIIFVNLRERRAVPNACYVIADEEGNASYKRFRPGPERYEPVSNNKDHDSIFPSEERPIRIVGRVCKSVLFM